MSIVTRTGDQGTTALMYNRRVSKNHPRVEAYGAVDELNAALGVARASIEDAFVRESLAGVQKDLVRLMGELATAVEDLPRYLQDGHELVVPGMTSRLDGLITKAEAAGVSPGDWATPGANLISAALDLARAVCRRAERRACALQDTGQLHNPEIVIYLNRLSDLLWLLARWVEAKPG
jgi:cob(I)alamin adenosyltransferase